MDNPPDHGKGPGVEIMFTQLLLNYPETLRLDILGRNLFYFFIHRSYSLSFSLLHRQTIPRPGCYFPGAGEYN